MPSPGTGEISADPEFTDASAFDFSLRSTSPAIDAGDPAYTDPDGTTADMGAIPFLQRTSVAGIATSWGSVKRIWGDPGAR